VGESSEMRFVGVTYSHSRRRRHRSLHRKPQAPQIRWANTVYIIKTLSGPMNLVGPEAVSDRWQRQREMAEGTHPMPFLEPEPEGTIVFRAMKPRKKRREEWCSAAVCRFTITVPYPMVTREANADSMPTRCTQLADCHVSYPVNPRSIEMPVYPLSSDSKNSKMMPRD